MTPAPAPCVGRSHRRGVVLVLVASLLTLLALLGMVMVRLTTAGREMTRTHVERSRAALLAASGLESAMARLYVSWAAPVVRTASNQREDWSYRDDATVSLERAHNPSYAAGEPYEDVTADGRYESSAPSADGFTPSVHDRNGDGRHTGFSGRLRGALASYGDTFALRIDDESAKINVNGGLLDAINRDAFDTAGVIPDHRDPYVASPSPGTGIGWNHALARILDVLGLVRETDADGDGVVDPSEDWNGNGTFDPAPIGIPDLGRKVIENRPLGGYRSIRALQQALGTAVDLSPYLTVASWSDGKVVHPVAYDEDANENGALDAGEDTNGNGALDRQPALGDLGAMSDVLRARAALDLEVGGRPPVNLNTASRPVLVALLQDLRGGSWQEPIKSLTYRITPAVAARVAGAVWEFREGRDSGGWFAAAGLTPGQFRTWGEFGAFCDSLAPWAISGLNAGGSRSTWGGGNQSGADLLKANFDPNTALNKGMPDQLMWRWIDKSDLIAGSTEGSLGPTGMFRVTSLGRIADRFGAVRAERQVEATSELFRIARQTTQEDFVGGRTLADAPRYLSLATTGEPTTGAGASWLGGGTGLAAVTYPCPMTALPGRAARFDGSISLATRELEPVHPFGGPLPVTFWHRFDDSWDADAGGSLGRTSTSSGMLVSADARLDGDVTRSTWPAPPGEPNTLLPDGAYVQWGRAPTYAAPLNLPNGGRHAVVGFWIKIAGEGNHGLSGLYARMAFVCNHPVPGEGTHNMMIGYVRPFGVFGICGETAARALDDEMDGFLNEVSKGRKFDLDPYNRMLMPGARWELVTTHWDLDSVPVTPAESLEVFLSGSRGDPAASYNAARVGTGGGYPGDFRDVAASAEDLAVSGGVFALGGSYTDPRGLGANHVIDEFAVCDFGAAPGPALNAATAWHADRYVAGRYYKGDDGKFLSTVLAPEGGGAEVRLLAAHWTGHLPGDRRQEFVLANSVGGGVPASGAPRVVDATLQNAALGVDLMEEDGTTLVRPLAQGGAISLRRSRFRYRVTFRSNLADSINQPVLESPVFDDITFLYQLVGKIRIVSYDE
ncbi:MAG: hypothetical protein HY608_04115 [Planctomycetes bacterium]|nr:hypothetical protein [Planctomycetota bacterium]